MVSENHKFTNIKTLVVGCTPLARKVVDLLEKITDFRGVINLNPEIGIAKSNYDYMSDFFSRRPDDVFWTKNINDIETVSWIKGRQPDIIVQCGWSQIFKKDILEIPKKYCIGVHPSPLPEGRGAAIINWKIIESFGQEFQWGNSLFKMREKTDTGPIIDFEPFMIEPRDDVRTAYLKVDFTTLKMLRRAIPKIEDGTIELVPQDDTRATRYYKRAPKDGKIDLSWSSKKINDYIRALTHPYPGAFLKTKAGDLTLWAAESDIAPSAFRSLPVGEICDKVRGKGVAVKTGSDDAIWLKRVSFEGSEQWADDWLESSIFSVGDSLIEK